MGLYVAINGTIVLLCFGLILAATAQTVRTLHSVSLVGEHQFTTYARNVETLQTGCVWASDKWPHLIKWVTIVISEKQMQTVVHILDNGSFFLTLWSEDHNKDGEFFTKPPALCQWSSALVKEEVVI